MPHLKLAVLRLSCHSFRQICGKHLSHLTIVSILSAPALTWRCVVILTRTVVNRMHRRFAVINDLLVCSRLPFPATAPQTAFLSRRRIALCHYRVQNARIFLITSPTGVDRPMMHRVVDFLTDFTRAFVSDYSSTLLFALSHMARILLNYFLQRRAETKEEIRRKASEIRTSLRL